MAINTNIGYKTFGKNRAVRLKGIDYSKVEYPVHVITGTKNKVEVFKNPGFCEIAKEQLWKISQQEIAIIAWCLMPDHLHILFYPEKQPVNVNAAVHRIKGVIAKIINEKYLVGDIWQRGFYDRVLRKADDLTVVSEYIICNPVRKGIVKDHKKYKYSWSKYHS